MESGLTRLRVISAWSALVKGKGKGWFARTDRSQGLMTRPKSRLYIRWNMSHQVHFLRTSLFDDES